MSENHPEKTALVSVRSVVAFLVFCELASGFTQGFYAPLLKDLAVHLGVSDAEISWFLTVQVLAAAVSVPLLSKLGDIFGHRRLLRLAVISVLIGTLITALVPSYPVVLFGRLLVGPLAVWLPLEIALVHNRVTGEQARKSVGLLVTFLTAGAIAGTLTSGLVSAVSPSLTLTLLTPCLFVLISVYAVFFKVPESTSRTQTQIDYLGFVGIAVFMIATLIGLRLIDSAGLFAPATLVTLLFAAIVFGLWVVWELRTSVPAVDLRLVTSRRVGPIYLAGMCFGMVLFGGQAFISTFLGSNPDVTGYGFNATASTTSYVIGAITILSSIGAAVFSYVAARIGIRGVLLLGAALAASGNFLLLPLHTSLGGYLAAAMIQGAGYGLLLGGLPARLAELAPSDSTGIAVGVYNSLRTLGGALAGAIFAAMLGAATASVTEITSLNGYRAIWIFSGSAFIISLISLLFLSKEEKESAAVTA